MSLKLLLIISAICTCIFMIVMVVHGSPLKTFPYAPHGIINLELAGSPTSASEIIKAWSPQLVPLAIKNTYIDFLFLLSYGTLLYSLCRTVSVWFQGIWRKIGFWLSIAMLVAAFFDAMENILMLKTLKGSLGKELVASTYMFASVKFLIVLIGILYILLSVIGKITRPKQTAYKEFS